MEQELFIVDASVNNQNLRNLGVGKLVNFSDDFIEVGYFDNPSDDLIIFKISKEKAIEFKTDYVEAHNNLNIILRQNKLLLNIEQAKNSKKKTLII